MDAQAIYMYQNNPNDPASRGTQRPNNGGNGNNAGGPRDNGTSLLIRSILLVVVVLVGWYLFQYFTQSNNNTTSANTLEVPYSTFYQQVENDNVKTASFQGQDVTGTFKNAITITDANGNTKTGTSYHFTQLPNGDPKLTQLLIQHNVQFQAKPANDNNLLLNIIINLLPWVLVFGVFLLIARRATQSQQNIFSFGKSKAKLVLEDRPSTTFSDVAGVDEAKNDLVEVVEFLKTPQKFQRLGGKIPRGVLLVGPPGTGKTLLARAVAGEAGVPFFSMSGSEFVEVLVGVGASRVRDLFDQAKKAAPSIIFIDEIDAVGRQRGSSINSNDEREQTLNQLLVEMDGFDARQAVVVIAATNRPDGLDKALMRPGRFDRRVTVDRPDWNGRLAILKIHSRDVPLANDVDLITIARATPGMVGADIANLVNEAALLAARRNLDHVTQSCFDEALDKILLGAERPLILSDEDLNVIAYHEGGHALTGLLLEHVDPVTKVTIVPRGQALGVTMYTPLDDRYNYSKDYLQDQLVTALGGRAAEEVAIGRITTGAENDLQRVTGIARQMVARWGMSEQLGTISYSEREDPFAGTALATGSREYSEKTASIIDEEVNRMVNWAHNRAVSLLTEHRETLDRIAKALRLHETIDAKQLREIMVETGAINEAPTSYR
ncbi:ATP-dependent metallopeptidase FtsH/Yme1/Tma family protein [Ktedonosporobacter rubrisoli]|uniref:ATP-dependent zinc metalloprotease FtsH n=1 Tax=Ktedonosporobacter rubrisoli TaxID=2509675 RepID=A0A4P6JZI5_KTERU|nr:ATP-dependent zinc metalloprotease FtsH [Ktedonosporobacter rubrisoli]QBD80526.1 ATP-dependent metallopeptidase FtsH/Yme1/Tma family protein [Ktedonosporobacter rubrisoli]